MFEVHILSIIGINLDVKKNKLDGMEISARKKYGSKGSNGNRLKLKKIQTELDKTQILNTF